MKKVFRFFVLCAAIVLALSCFTACTSAKKSTQLAKPTPAEPLTYQERKDAAFDDIKQSAELFASKFTYETYKDYDNSKNFAVSPVSVYMALALSAECAAGDTRNELLSTLNVSYPVLESQFSDFYRSLIAEYKYDGKVIGRLDLSNSIWVDKLAQPKDACIQALADKYYGYSYSADFRLENKAANNAIRDFVKEHTHGLIDQDFQLPARTLFALINTLYLKDVWNGSGADLPFTAEKYNFTKRDGTAKELNLLQGSYIMGRTVETETFRHYYTQTKNGYKIKFILPNEGYSIDEIFTEENLSTVNALTDYGAIDEKNKIEYYTRCLFPEFSAEYNKDVKHVLKSAFGVNKFFTADECDFSTLTDDGVFCEKVQHVTKLAVDKTGVEGAAVTIVAMGPTSAPPEPEYEKVFEDFIVDGAFGFILTDRYGVTLFSGVVNQV